MPCDKCGSLLVLNDDVWTCPKCNHLNILSKNEAIKISADRIKFVNSMFTSYFQRFEKKRLIVHVVWAREKFARNFFSEYQGFDIYKFLTLNLLLKRLMAAQNYKNEIEADDKSVEEIVNLFSQFIRVFSSHVLLTNGFSNMIYKNSFDYEKLTAEQLLANFETVPTESYKPLLLTYENNDILNSIQGQTKIENYKKEFERITSSKNNKPKRDYTPQEFVEHFYSTINQFYCSLLMNELFAKIFNFVDSGFILLSPRQLMDFVNKFSMVIDCQTVVKREDFLNAFGSYCPYTNEELEKLFVFDENNQKIFPLFVGLDDYVFISHRTSFLIHIFLMAIIYKDIFNSETERRSKELEKNETRIEFEKIGFRYISDIVWKNHLQIDGLAIRDNVAYVMECKEWGIRPLYYHSNIQLELERDLKGIVDGVKYSTIEGKTREKKIVSLLEKIEFVKKNLSRWNLSDSVTLNGIIVIRDYPPIVSYKNVRIIPLNEVTKL